MAPRNTKPTPGSIFILSSFIEIRDDLFECISECFISNSAFAIAVTPILIDLTKFSFHDRFVLIYNDALCYKHTHVVIAPDIRGFRLQNALGLGKGFPNYQPLQPVQGAV